MKKLRTRMILTLMAVNTVSSGLSEILSWVLIPVLFGERSTQINQLFKASIQGLITLCIFVWLVIIGINELTQPLVEIAAAAGRVAAGDYTVQIPQTARRDEIGNLQRSFAAMLEELKSTEYMQKDFASNVSHEFKTPLAVISGYARLITREELTREERMQCGQAIAEEADRLGKLASNILLLSKISHQGILPPFAPYALDEQLRQSVLMLEAMWREKGLDVEVDVPQLTVVANEELLSHVWRNLIENAVKYSRQDGKIWVKARREAGRVMVTVGDDGIGMDEETKARVFEQFFQGDTSRVGHGNGLGLALAWQVVQLHGGSIDVWSAPGAGSVFTVTLPDRAAP